VVITDNVVAILLGTLANSIYNIGLVFKKKGACTLPDIEKQSVWQNIKNFARCRTWLFGFSLTILQWFPLMYAIKIGSLSLVAPTMAVGFIVLILFSWLYLKEPINVMEIVGIVVVMGSIITLYTISPIDTGDYTLIQMNHFLKEGNAIAFLCSFATIIGILLGFTFGKRFRYAGALMAMGSGLSYATATIFAKAAIGSLTFANIPAFLENSLSAWQWWIYLFLMCCGYLVAFNSQQMALQKGKALVVSPIIDIMNLFMQIMAGIFVFNEWHTIWDDLLLWKKVIKTMSLILIIVGVVMLSFFKAKEEVAMKLIETKEEIGDGSMFEKPDEIKQDTLASDFLDEKQTVLHND